MRKQWGPRCLSHIALLATSLNSGIDGTYNLTVASLKMVATNALEKMNIDETDLEPKTDDDTFADWVLL